MNFILAVLREPYAQVMRPSPHAKLRGVAGHAVPRGVSINACIRAMLDGARQPSRYKEAWPPASNRCPLPRRDTLRAATSTWPEIHPREHCRGREHARPRSHPATSGVSKACVHVESVPRALVERKFPRADFFQRASDEPTGHENLAKWLSPDRIPATKDPRTTATMAIAVVSTFAMRLMNTSGARTS